MATRARRGIARNVIDLLARAALEHLARADHHELAQALIDFFNDDGPFWALPPGDWLLTRYSWTTDGPQVVSVHGTRLAAERALVAARNATPGIYEVASRGGPR